MLAIETSNSLETTVEVQEGMEIDRGYISPQFVNNGGRAGAGPGRAGAGRGGAAAAAAGEEAASRQPLDLFCAGEAASLHTPAAPFLLAHAASRLSTAPPRLALPRPPPR